MPAFLRNLPFTRSRRCRDLTQARVTCQLQLPRIANGDYRPKGARGHFLVRTTGSAWKPTFANVVEKSEFGDIGRSRVATGDRTKSRVNGCIRKSRTSAADPLLYFDGCRYDRFAQRFLSMRGRLCRLQVVIDHFGVVGLTNLCQYLVRETDDGLAQVGLLSRLSFQRVDDLRRGGVDVADLSICAGQIRFLAGLRLVHFVLVADQFCLGGVKGGFLFREVVAGLLNLIGIGRLFEKRLQGRGRCLEGSEILLQIRWHRKLGQVLQAASEVRHRLACVLTQG